MKKLVCVVVALCLVFTLSATALAGRHHGHSRAVRGSAAVCAYHRDCLDAGECLRAGTCTHKENCAGCPYATYTAGSHRGHHAAR